MDKEIVKHLVTQRRFEAAVESLTRWSLGSVYDILLNVPSEIIHEHAGSEAARFADHVKLKWAEAERVVTDEEIC